MKLYYKINYNTTNMYFKHIIQDLIKQVDIQAQCRQYKGYLIFIIDDTAEQIEDFFKVLEILIPKPI